MSSGSAERPRVARCIRVPVDDQGVASMSLRMWRDDDESQEDVETVPCNVMTLPGGLGPDVCLEDSVEPKAEGCAEVTDSVGLEGGLSDLGFADYARIYVQWAESELTDARGVQRYGRHTLDLMQNQWAVEGDTQLEGQRAMLLAGVVGHGVPPQPSSEEMMGLPVERHEADQEHDRVDEAH